MLLGWERRVPGPTGGNQGSGKLLAHGSGKLPAPGGITPATPGDGSSRPSGGNSGRGVSMNAATGAPPHPLVVEVGMAEAAPVALLLAVMEAEAAPATLLLAVEVSETEAAPAALLLAVEMVEAEAAPAALLLVVETEAAPAALLLVVETEAAPAALLLVVEVVERLPAPLAAVVGLMLATQRESVVAGLVAKRTRAARLVYIWWQRYSALRTSTVLKNDGLCRAHQDVGKVHGRDAGGLALQKLVWPAPQQELLVPEPEVQALEPELPAPERKPAVQELQLSEEEELPPSEPEGEDPPELQQELQLNEEEELTCPAPPQPRPAPQQSSPALVGTVPCPVLVDTLPECMDLPVLDLVPRSGHHQAQLLTWSLAPLLLKPQTSRRGSVTSLAFPLPPAVFPLESQRLLRRSRGSHLCLSLHRPGYRPTRRLPLASCLGPSSPDRGPYPKAPEESTHPQAHPKDREKVELCGLEGETWTGRLTYARCCRKRAAVPWNPPVSHGNDTESIAVSTKAILHRCEHTSHSASPQAHKPFSIAVSPQAIQHRR
ncbi:UNVERIFIED_CONTAM: hypothetical protein FKN15_058416 [Acipenser sinensis]